VSGDHIKLEPKPSWVMMDEMEDALGDVNEEVPRDDKPDLIAAIRNAARQT
jgi:hypothetical protein